ncbi:unnamed protein product [Adineta steineri]|uniref:F5/8 type C domain-containing protein n=2 Tax=Adineta steineri TaxID=433720 RepID=A0A814THE3_9BILA|nr:unnamed protein product [Adineta steineri]
MVRICRVLALSFVLLVEFYADIRTSAVTAATPLPANPVSAPANAISLSHTGWTVVADSAQPGNEAKYALDGDTGTFWLTEWNPTKAPMPHNITIDMKVNYIVYGICYLPRQDGIGNGTFGGHAIYLSTDGKTWESPVAKGTWLDDENLKCTSFSGTIARYVLCVILFEAGNRGPWASAAEIQVLTVPSLGYSLPRTTWVVKADSAETIGMAGQAQNACDGDQTTLWHTQYTNTLSPLPHTFTIDQKTPVSVDGLMYLPRQDGNANGRIGNFTVEYSTDGANWKTLVTGQWADDATLKSITFTDTTARYFCLVSKTEAGNRGPWTSAAEIYLLSSKTFTAPSNTLGKWGPTIDFPTVPVAAACLNNGQVMIWSAYSPYDYVGSPSNQTITAIYDQTTGQVSEATITHTNHDMFCSGTSLDFQGRLFVTGGNSGQMTSMYGPIQSTWSAMGQTILPRGYQAQATLSDGRIFVIGGSWTYPGGTLRNGEIYDPSTNTWTLLPGCLVTPMLTNDTQDYDETDIYRSDNHGWLFSWKNGYVFQAGPSKAMNWYSTKGSGSQSSAGSRASDTNSMCGNAVMYDATNGKILTVGGSPDYQDSYATKNAHIITITTGGALPTVTTINSMSYARAFANAVVLPDGKVFITGGQAYAVPFSDDTSVFCPELWDPTTNKFTTLNANNIPRNYHSVALLLPDGTVFSGGSEFFSGNTLQQWIQRQPHHFLAAMYRSSSDMNNAIGPYGSALLNEAKTAIANKSITQRFLPATLTSHHHT